MALEYQLNSQTFTGTGNVTVYTVSFPVFAASHIVVTGTTAAGAAFTYTQGVHYTVALRQNAAGDYIGAIITLANPLPSGYRMTVSRIVPIVQQTVFYNQGGMQPEVVERQLDYLTMICQQINPDTVVAGLQFTFLKLAGGTMAGDINMGSNSLVFGSRVGFDHPKIDLYKGTDCYQFGVASPGILWFKSRLTHQFYASDVSTDTPIAYIDKTDVYHGGTGLKAAINGKAEASHIHTIANVTGLQTAINGKADASHLHDIADVTGLQAILNAKAALSHNHVIADVTGLQVALNGKAALSHAHAIADVTGLQAALTTANERIAEMEARARELENGLAQTMPYAPDDGRLHVAMGGAWYPLRLEGGEPFERVGDAVQPVVGIVLPTAIWDVGPEYTYTLKLDSKPGDSDSFFERTGADTFILKNFA